MNQSDSEESVAKSGYETKLFVLPPAKDFICGLCLDVMNNPLQCCTEGHCYCSECILDAMISDRRCPLCRVKVPKTYKFVKNLAVRNLIDNLEVRCNVDAQATCNWTGPLHQRAEHIKADCPLTETECTHAGCNEQMPRFFIQDHEAGCEFKMVTCSQCILVTLPQRDITTHMPMDCISRPMSSVYTQLCSKCDYCDESMPCHQLQTHQTEECRRRRVQCSLCCQSISYALISWHDCMKVSRWRN